MFLVTLLLDWCLNLLPKALNCLMVFPSGHIFPVSSICMIPLLHLEVFDSCSFLQFFFSGEYPQKLTGTLPLLAPLYKFSPGLKAAL